MRCATLSASALAYCSREDYAVQHIILIAQEVIMNTIPNAENCPVILQPTGLCVASNDGIDINGLFRFGCGYPRLAKDGRHAWVLDLYQRKAIVSGKALACDVPAIPDGDSVVRVKGRMIDGEAGPFIWVRELLTEPVIGTDVCALDLVTPSWVVNQDVADRLCEIWASLAPPYRELINAVMEDPAVLQGFLKAPGSIRHHDAVSGGCAEHSLKVARMAIAIADLTPTINRDMLITGAILHDIGKCIEYRENNHGRWSMSRFGKRVGHKVGGALLVSAAAKRCNILQPEQVEDVLHMLTSSFAPTWAGYRVPATREALALSAIDRLCGAKATSHQ